MSRTSHRFYGRCHLMAQDISFGKADLKFVSGSCEGPAANTTAADLGVFGYGIEVGTLCGRIMADVDSLRVWLAVKENVNLDASSLADLYAILEMVEVCPLDDEFEEVLQRFEGVGAGGDSSFQRSSEDHFFARWFDSVVGEWTPTAAYRPAAGAPPANRPHTRTCMYTGTRAPRPFQT